MGFAIATGHALTTEAAETALRSGGTAVDACVAAACMAFVVEPVLAQPLGGGFLMLAPQAGPVTLLDGFVQTPRQKPPEGDLDIGSVTVDFGTATQDFHIGPGTVAAPCLIPALFEAHAQAGRMPMTEVVAPAVAVARQGHKITAMQAYIAGLVTPILNADPAVAALHLDDGAAPAPGTQRANPDLGDVLEVMAFEGPRFFTEGEVAQALVGLPGGALSALDLRRAQPLYRTPLSVERLGHTIALNPPPSLGGVQIALALHMLHRVPDPADMARVLAGVARIRAELHLDADPATAGRALDPDLVARLRASLSAHRAAVRGTTHISIVDNQGMGAALTLSNGEGCGRLLPGTGIMPNNMLGEEDLVPAGPTAWTPDTRLASMMCPVAVRGPEDAVTVLGSGGSARIRSALTTVLVDLVDRDLGLAEALAAPRMHVEDGGLAFEDLGDEEGRAALLGDWPEAAVWQAPNFFFGGVHIARQARSGAVDAASDPRRDGCAVTG